MFPYAFNSYFHHYYHKYNDVSIFSPRICKLFGDVYLSHFEKKVLQSVWLFGWEQALKYLNWLYNIASLSISNSVCVFLFLISAVYSVLNFHSVLVNSVIFFNTYQEFMSCIQYNDTRKKNKRLLGHSTRSVNTGKHVWKFKMQQNTTLWHRRLATDIHSSMANILHTRVFSDGK